MLVTGGGVDNNGRWICCKKKYLVPVKALSKLIRGKFKARLKRRDYDEWHEDKR
ncbi:MAG TPA: IS91 family transposase, partial [Phycisphaerales bacterium]|nr:IS91 family transposase [Phycisphaerales bacterium]